jgi:hypothetical protein
VLVVREDVSNDAPENCESVEVVETRILELEGGFNVKIIELVVLVLVVREDVSEDAPEGCRLSETQRTWPM